MGYGPFALGIRVERGRREPENGNADATETAVMAVGAADHSSSNNSHNDDSASALATERRAE